MRVLMISHEFPPLGGGGARLVKHLLDEYGKKDVVTVDLITASAHAGWVRFLNSRVAVHALDIGKRRNLQHMSARDLLIFTWKAFWLTRKLRSRRSYDLVHACFTIPAGLLARMLHIPYVVSLLGSDVPGHSPSFTLEYKMLSPLVRNIWRHAHAIVAVSKGLAAEARLFDPTVDVKYSILPGVDTVIFQPPVSTVPREPGQTFRVIYAGRLHPVKGLSYLLDGFASFSSGKKDVELLIVGDGPEAVSLRDRAASMSQVLFLDWQEEKDLVSLYQNSDVYVLPSVNEAAGMTLLEAMATGIPVIGTNVGGIPEVIGEEAGIIVRPKSSEAIAEALERLYKGKAERERMGKIARARAVSMGWGNVARRYEQVYRNVAGSGPA